MNGLDILGAGIVITISKIINAILLLRKINSNETTIDVNILDKWSNDKGILKSITKIGLPSSFE